MSQNEREIQDKGKPERNIMERTAEKMIPELGRIHDAVDKRDAELDRLDKETHPSPKLSEKPPNE